MLYPILALGVAMAAEPVTLGAPARAFSLPAANQGDAAVVLHDYVGLRAPDPKAGAVVHFYTGVAGAQALPVLEKLAREHKDVQILAVTTGRTVGAVASEVSRASVDFPVLYDEHGVVFQRYAVTRGPLTLVVDQHGDIVSIGSESDTSVLGEHLGAAVAELEAGD